jgi:non-heme chloroperoxidase
MPTITVNGAPLAYEERGTGEPAVLIHGTLEDLRAWRFQMAPFAARFRVIAYSRRYHYPNARPQDSPDDPPYTAALHAADLAGLIERLGLGPAHLVASSYGGCVALLMAVQRPELVRSLVLGEPPLMPWLRNLPGGTELAASFERDAWLPAGRALADGDEARGVGLFLDAVMGRRTFERLSPAARAPLLDNAPALRAETASAAYFPSLTPADVRGIEAPALALEAGNSPPLFHMIAAALAANLPHCTRDVIPAAPHAMHLGNAERYNQAVLAFLSGLTR